MKWRPRWRTELILASHVNTPTYLKKIWILAHISDNALSVAMVTIKLYFLPMLISLVEKKEKAEGLVLLEKYDMSPVTVR